MTMRKLFSLFSILVAWRGAFWLLLLMAGILHMGTTVTGGLYADDYIHKAMFLGAPALEEKGLLEGIGIADLSQLLSDQFNFFDPRAANYQAMMEFGMLPWWASQDALLHFFRPLATVTHYLDYQWWPNNTHLMHFVSLCWYLLGVAAIYALYRGVGVERPVALLALLLVVLDHSMYQVVTWIASRSMLLVIAFGFFAVYAYHRSISSRLWYVLALLALALAALSAEAVVAICAYLGAYMFTLDQRPWLKRVVHILPFALLVMAWQLLYRAGGFGTYGVDFYIDPGHEPEAFLQAALYRLPGNFFELVSGIDVVSGLVRPDIHHRWFALGGAALFALMSWLLLPLLRSERRVAFFFLGSFLALIPGLTIALAPRVMMLPFAGMAVVLAYLVHFFLANVWDRGRQRIAIALLVHVFLFHVLLSFILAVTTTWSSIIAVPPDKPLGYVDLGVKDIADKPVVLVNAFRPFWLAFYPYHLLEQGQALPSSLRVLSGAFYPMTLTRVSERELLLESKPGFQYDATSLTPMEGRAMTHFVYLVRELMGLIRASRDEWQPGKIYTFPEMTITVSSLYNGKPASLEIRLLQDPADYRWSYWNRLSGRYEMLVVPLVGETVRMDGLMDEKGFLH